MNRGRVDAHHHLWDPARRAYPWMDDSVAAIRRPFDVEDLDAAAGRWGSGRRSWSRPSPVSRRPRSCSPSPPPPAASPAPHVTATPPGARRVYLNLSPGRVTVTEVLEAVAATVPLEAAAVMRPHDADAPAVLEEYRALLPPDLPVEVVERMAFYELTRRPEVSLAVATGDQRLYANLLLTIGYIDPAAG